MVYQIIVTNYNYWMICLFPMMKMHKCRWSDWFITEFININSYFHIILINYYLSHIYISNVDYCMYIYIYCDFRAAAEGSVKAVPQLMFGPRGSSSSFAWTPCDLESAAEEATQSVSRGDDGEKFPLIMFWCRELLRLECVDSFCH